MILAFTAKAQNNTTPTYHEIIESYQELSLKHKKHSRLLEAGKTDAGLPLHLFVIDPSGKFDPQASHRNGDLVCLIMNGIHPGEPCGIDASLAFATAQAASPTEGVVYCIIPVYNVGGALNRNNTSRVNQNGPEEYGFRGNAKNLDLNRDFIKSDAGNTFAFAELFHQWRPHVFVDTHTSNGSDYQATMTLIHSTPAKMHPMQGAILERDIVPTLYRGMIDKDAPMTPYVNNRGESPDYGIEAFNDLPRYSMGYAALWNTLAFTTEAHMLKPYPMRVTATLRFLEVLHSALVEKRDILIQLKKVADTQTAQTNSFSTKWKLTTFADSVLFAGYHTERVPSAVTGQNRLRYDRNQPYEKKIAFYKEFESVSTYQLPQAYIIPQGWWEIVERLRVNGLKVQTFKNDTIIEVTAYYIENFETVKEPYEGHYLHYNTEVSNRKVKVKFYAGDHLVKCDQAGNRYLAHIFDPRSDDSFFNWNFFDALLMQKEYFSAYLFEDTAAELLRRNKALAKAFEEKKQADAVFAGDAHAQLDFIYKNSKYFESSHRRLPVYRIER